MLSETKKSVYEQVVYNFDIERSFADELEKNSAVKVYAKLPGWFRLLMPLGLTILIGPCSFSKMVRSGFISWLRPREHFSPMPFVAARPQKSYAA